MKNPENKPLEIVWEEGHPKAFDHEVALVLSNLAVAESNLVRAGKQSALPHFIAIVKEIEERLGFKFEIMEQE